MADILLAPACVFAVLYGLLLFTLIYEVIRNFDQLQKGYGYPGRMQLHWWLVLYCAIKATAYSLRAYEAEEEPDELATETAILIPSSLTLFLGTIFLVRGLAFHLSMFIRIYTTLVPAAPASVYYRLLHFIYLGIALWLGTGIAAIVIESDASYPISSNTVDTIELLKRISGWTAVGTMVSIGAIFVDLSLRLYRIGTNENAPERSQWTEEYQFQLFLTIFVRLFCTTMLLIGLIWSAVSATLSFYSTSVWLEDEVFYPLKATTEFLATIALIQSSPVFHSIAEKYLYDRVKHRLPYYSPSGEKNAVHPITGTGQNPPTQPQQQELANGYSAPSYGYNTPSYAQQQQKGIYVKDNGHVAGTNEMYSTGMHETGNGHVSPAVHINVAGN